MRGPGRASTRHFSFLPSTTRTRKEIKGVESAGALGARPGALDRPRCRHGEPLGARLKLRRRNPN
eukprot:scaffold54298_cov44-Phaeocystis_antarctica.AAC.3